MQTTTPDPAQPPTLSHGYASSFSTLSQSLSFHASPHAFLSERGQVDTRGPPPAVAAKILNRNVAVFASHGQCREILDAEEAESRSIRRTAGGNTFAALPAYRQLMVDFFPQPNLLLLDGEEHGGLRGPWNKHMAGVCANSGPFIREVARREVARWREGKAMDVYECMKDLGWRLLLGVFLGLGPEEPEYEEMVKLQEDLLRGQFSLFPVAISMPFWSSARSRGLKARKKLQGMLRERLGRRQASCPFARAEGIEEGEVAANALLFTSSIALKSLASLLTASLLNIHLLPGEKSLAERLRSCDGDGREALMRSILKETERLSPPVIGVMRRVQEDIVLAQPDGTDATVPSGWDAWLYFVGANRNESVYDNASVFDAERFVNDETHKAHAEPLAFGAGQKRCLGRDLVREMVYIICDEIVGAVDLDGCVEADGVRGWLGWDGSVGAEGIAKDMKQLPCQRPREAIMLHVRRRD
ncbi:hypothetical protein K4F52_005183 [Lecanicillium sp. MT-2017a]|nr:hypothetical protein K4F52_005183 [Lecanicillium sp. MT-2017a]